MKEREPFCRIIYDRRGNLSATTELDQENKGSSTLEVEGEME